MKTIILFCLMLMVYQFTMHFALHYTHGDFPTIQILFAFLSGIVNTAFFITFLRYMGNWKYTLKKRSPIFSVFKIVICPYILLFFKVVYDFNRVLPEKTLLLYAISIYVFYLFFHNRMIDYIFENIDKKRNADGLPNDRMDMMLTDIAMLMFVILPFFLGEPIFSKPSIDVPVFEFYKELFTDSKD